MIDITYRNKLELSQILEQLSGCAIFFDTKELAQKIEPACRIQEVERLLKSTIDINSLAIKYGYPSYGQVTNSIGSLKRAQLGSSLTLRELLNILQLLRCMRSLIAWKAQSSEINSSVTDLFECLYSNRALENTLSSAIISDDELDDAASPELSDIRRKIRNAALKIRSQLDGMIHSATYQKYLQDPIVTIRDGRFVVPVKAEYRNEVKGLVHDTSSSGATFFIEPMSVVEANNEIKILENKEQLEIERIIAELSARVGEVGEELIAGYEAALQIDLLFAKSRLADRMKASAVEVNDMGETVLKSARHPLIAPSKAVPINISVGGEYDTLVITGPNTGGKTVAIKTLGLLTLMTMCGLMIPASQGSKVSVFEQVLSDIGDEQSIEHSLSTFSSHMVNIIKIINTANARSLVLLDELGAGTDPVEGAALAVAILETLRKKGARVLATTHYPEIKMYALQTQGVENASCEFDVATLRPTYRLLTGIPGRSNAFLISEKLGLSTEIIERAKTRVSGNDTRFEDIVSELEQTRQELEHEKAAARTLRLEAQEIKLKTQEEKERLETSVDKELERARGQAKNIIEETKMQAEILFEELDSIKKEKDAEQFSKLLSEKKLVYRNELKELEKNIDPIQTQEDGYTLPRPLEKGDIVFIRTLNKEGLVINKPEGSSVQIQAGVIKTTVPISDVVLGGALENKKQSKSSSGRVTKSNVTSKAARDIKTELDLRGQDAEQAVMELNSFIDNAVMSGIESIRIIHGKGTGVLRSAVSARLKGHKNIASFRLGRYGEGEDGVTIAEIK